MCQHLESKIFQFCFVSKSTAVSLLYFKLFVCCYLFKKSFNTSRLRFRLVTCDKTGPTLVTKSLEFSGFLTIISAWRPSTWRNFLRFSLVLSAVLVLSEPSVLVLARKPHCFRINSESQQFSELNQRNWSGTIFSEQLCSNKRYLTYICFVFMHWTKWHFAGEYLFYCYKAPSSSTNYLPPPVSPNQTVATINSYLRGRVNWKP
jgi:hypothetical protein